MKYAPIAFFAFRRPEHTRRALESLAQNPLAEESELYIFCDGPRNTEDKPAVAEVRRLVRSRSWCGRVEIIEQEANRGLANSIIDGVTILCKKFGKAIVIEDDLILSPHFLHYLNSALDKYYNINQVYQISAFLFDIKPKPALSSFFLPLTTSWGWATWQRSWEKYDPSLHGLKALEDDAKMKTRFDLNGAYSFYDMAVAARNNSLDSWAIRWYLSVFLKDGLVLYPPKTLVKNKGFDATGTHCHTDLNLDGKLTENTRYLLPDKIEINSNNFNTIISFLKKESKK